MKKRLSELKKWETKTLGITTIEWMCLFGSVFFIMLLVSDLIPKELSSWRKMVLILFMGGIFVFILYLLLFLTKQIREQDREKELVNSVEDYFSAVIKDKETADTVIEELRSWAALPKEIRYKKDKETNH